MSSYNPSLVVKGVRVAGVKTIEQAERYLEEDYWRGGRGI
jgi:hypothetical protein